jgi:hypothetical protein
MANYTDSNLEAAVARFIGSFTDGMERSPFIEFWKVLQKNSDYIFPEAMAVRESSKRSIKTKIMKTILETPTGERSCTINGTFGDAVTQTLNWTSVALAGKVSMKQHQDNEFALQEAIQKRIADLRKSILTSLEASGQAWFAANRSTVNDATSYGSFDATNNVFEIAALDADQPGFLPIAEQMLNENRYRSGMYDMIANGFTIPQLRYYANQGQQNGANTIFGFENFQNIVNGLGYNDANYPNWFGYAMQSNLVGVLNWIPADYRNPREGQSVADNLGVKQWFEDPEIPGLIWAMKTILECDDTSAANGGDDDEVLKIQLSTDFSINYAPTEDGSTPIYAIASV